MFEFEPKNYDHVKSSNKLWVSGLADEIDKIERSATRDAEGKKLFPAKWIEWAQGRGYAVPDKFVKAVAKHEPAAVEQAAPVKTKAKVGRPKSIEKKADVMRQIIAAFEKAAGIEFSPPNLPGSAINLLDACQRLEKCKTGRAKEELFNIKKNTLVRWLKVAEYGFPDGCPPSTEYNYWTKLCSITMSLITPEVFIEVKTKVRRNPCQ